MEPRISLTMIVRDEEQNLPACLESVADLVDEIIVVDTGSTDRTRQVAEGFGAKVCDFPWTDDFGAARNESLRHATGRWVFWLDADDRVDAANRQRLAALFASLDQFDPSQPRAFLMSCYSPCVGGEDGTVTSHARLMSRTPDLRWIGRIHEQVCYTDDARQPAAVQTDVTVQHLGYSDSSAYLRKQERDLRILYAQHATNPADAATVYYIARTHYNFGRHGEAQRFCRMAIRMDPRGLLPCTRAAFALLAESLGLSHQRREAVAACDAGLAIYSNDVEMWYVKGMMLAELAELEGAASCFQHLLALPPPTYVQWSVDPRLRGDRAHCALATVYRRMGRPRDAEAHLRMALAQRPDCVWAWVELAQVCMEMRRWAELSVIARRLEGLPDGGPYAKMMRVLQLGGQNQFAEACAAAEQILAETPGFAWANSVLGQMLFVTGSNWERCAEVYRALVELEPDNTEARQRLRVASQHLAEKRGQQMPATPWASEAGAQSAGAVA